MELTSSTKVELFLESYVRHKYDIVFYNDNRVLYRYISVAISDVVSEASVAMPVQGSSCECSSGFIIVFSVSF